MIQELAALPLGVLMVLGVVALSGYASDIFNSLVRLYLIRKDRKDWEREQRKNRGL